MLRHRLIPPNILVRDRVAFCNQLVGNRFGILAHFYGRLEHFFEAACGSAKIYSGWAGSVEKVEDGNDVGSERIWRG